MFEFWRPISGNSEQRRLIVGINPDRLGAGITGISFTDPKVLEENCDIPNSFYKRNELSSLFVYELIDVLGGPVDFYRNFYIGSVCPLGFIKDGKNYSYYDDREIQSSLETYILKTLKQTIELGCYTDQLFVLGKGKNFKYVSQLNKKHSLFGRVIPLPHPRWILQYRRKEKAQILGQVIKALRI